MEWHPWSNEPPQRHPLACWIFDNVLHAGSALHIGAYGQIRIVSTSTYRVIRVCAVMRIQSTCSPKGGPAARDKTFRLRSRAIGILINPPPAATRSMLLLISLLFRTAESVVPREQLQLKLDGFKNTPSFHLAIGRSGNARRGEYFLCDAMRLNCNKEEEFRWNSVIRVIENIPFFCKNWRSRDELKK